MTANLESDFASETSCHGVRQVVYAPKNSIRLIWITCITASLCFFVWQFYELTTSYGQYNAVTEVKVKTHSYLDFPSATFCGYNRFKKSVLQKYAIRYNVTLDAIWEYLILSFKTENVVRGMSDKNSSNAAVNLRSLTDKIRAVEQSQMDIKKLVIDASSRFEDVVSSTPCYFADYFEPDFCQNNFKEQLTPDGLCFTFNDNINSTLKQSNIGTSDGFSTVLHANFSENSERLTELVAGKYPLGFLVKVHPKGMWPSLVSGVSFSPGKMAYLTIDKIVYENEKKPWGECVHHNLKYFPVYTEKACKEECIINHIHKECGCHPISFPAQVSENYRVCYPDDMLSCVTVKISQYKKLEQNCITNCKVACHFEEYRPTVNEIRSGSKDFINTISRMARSDYETFIKEWSMIEVYFRELQTLHYIQKEGKKMSDLIADIGGQLGLAMGISLITIAEFLVFSSGFLFGKFCQRCKKNKVNEVKRTLSTTTLTSVS